MTAKPVRVTVRAKGQITLPAQIVKAAGLTEGQHLRIEYRADHDLLVLRPLKVIPRKDVR